MSYKTKILGDTKQKEKLIAIAAIILVSVSIFVVAAMPPAQSPFSAGLNLYDADGNIIGTVESSQPLMSPIFQDYMTGEVITETSGFIKLTALINEDVLEFPDGIDINLSFGMYSGATISGGVLVQSGADLWHVDPWDVSGDLPEWGFTFDIIQLIDYFDPDDADAWVTDEMYGFTFKFVVAADWTTPFGDGGYRKIIPVYLVVKVVEYDPDTAVGMEFSASDMVGGSLDVDYVPYDGLNNLPTGW